MSDDQSLEKLTRDIRFVAKRDAQGAYPWEAIENSALLRIAHGIENMADDWTRLRQDAEYQRNRADDLARENRHLRHRVAGLAGTITRLKRKVPP